MKIVPSCSRCNNPIDQAADPAEGEASYCRKCSELLDDDDDDVGIGNGDSDKSEQTGAGSGAEGSTAPAQKNATTAALEDQQEDQPPAKIIDPELPDNYEILEVFEQCQHGRAYKIRDKNLEKVLIARFVTAGVARLTGGLSIETAAQLLTQINHPHLLTVYDWRTDLKTNCLIMDNAPETSVETIIAKEGFFDLPRAFDVFIQACEGLEELHKQRLVHGFVRPRTIRLAVTSDSKLDAVKVMSFSVTNVFSNNIDQPLKIGRNYTCNDAFYMSPEELNGALPTVSGDIYSLGCVIFHAITGKPLYRARTVKEVEQQHLDESPPRFRKRYEIPVNVEAVVLRMLQKDPKNRYQSIKSVRQDLERLRDNKEPMLEDRWRVFMSWFGA